MAPPYGTNFPFGDTRTAPAQGGGYGGPIANVRGYGGESVPHVIIAAGNGDVVGAVQRLLRSTDGGVTWAAIGPASANNKDSVVYIPPLRRFYAVGNGNAEVWISDDFGDSWTVLPGTMPAGNQNWNRPRWIEELGVLVATDGIASTPAHTTWLATSADGVTWARINTGISVVASAGAAWSSTLGLLGFGIHQNGALARIVLTPDLVAFSEINVVSGAGFATFRTVEGANGCQGDICATPARLVNSCIQTSSFQGAFWKNTADGIAVGTGIFPLGNNADCASAAYNPDADRIIVQLGNSAGQYGRSDDQGATWQVGALGIADPGTNVNCEYLPRAGKWFLMQRAPAAQADRILDSETGDDNDWTRRVTPAMSLRGIDESR